MGVYVHEDADDFVGEENEVRESERNAEYNEELDDDDDEENRFVINEIEATHDLNSNNK